MKRQINYRRAQKRGFIFEASNQNGTKLFYNYRNAHNYSTENNKFFGQPILKIEV